MIRAVTIALLVCLLSRTASAACAETDAECLIRQTLQLSNELEAERLRNSHLQRSNDLLQEALKQEEERCQSGPKVFIMGMVVGAVFVGLAATMAMKAVKS